MNKLIKLFTLIVIFLFSTNLYSQVDTIFNGYLSPFVITGGASPTWNFTSKFRSNQFNVESIDTSCNIIFKIGKDCYEVDVTSITILQGNVTGVIKDPTGSLEMNKNNYPRVAAIYKLTPNKQLIPFVEDLPSELQSCIQNFNLSKVDTIGSNISTIDTALVSQIAGDSASVAEQNAINYANSLLVSSGNYVTVDTTVSANYSAPIASEVRIISDVDDGDNVITLDRPVDSLKGNTVTVTHLDTTAANLGTTQIQTDFTNYDLYNGQDTVLSINLFANGQTVTLRVQEVLGALRWAVVEKSAIVQADEEISETGVIGVDGDGNLSAYDNSVSGERKLQYKYNVQSKEDLLTTRARYGDAALVSDTFGNNSPYILRLDSLSGFNTDSVAVIPAPNGYWHLQPKGDKYFYSQFRKLGVDGGEIINKAFSFMKAVRNNNIIVNDADIRVDSNAVVNSLFLDQQATSSQRIVIPEGMSLIGGNNSIYAGDDAGAPVLYFDLNNPTDTAIVFEDKFGGFDSNQYRRGVIKDMVIFFESECNIGIYYLGPMGDVLDNVYIEGKDFVNVGIKTSYTIFAEFNHLRVENCDTSLYISNYKPSTSFTSNFSTYTKGNVGIYVDAYANSSNIEFNRCYIESSSDAYAIIGTGNEVFFNGLETEGDGGLSTPYAQFIIGGNSTNKSNSSNREGTVAFYNSRISGDVNFAFDIDTLESLLLVNCDIAPGSGSKEFKGTNSFKSLTILGGSSTNTALNPGPDRGVLDSISELTSVSINHFNKSNGGVDYFVNYYKGGDNLTSFDKLYVFDNQEIKLSLPGTGGKITTSSSIATEDYPISIALANTDGDDYEGAIFGMIQHQTDKKSAAIKGRTRAINFSSDFSEDISIFESELDIRNGSGAALGNISAFASIPRWGNSNNTGSLSDVAHFRATSPTIVGTRNINNLSGLRIENIFTKSSAVNLSQAYGIKIDDLSLNTGTNTWSFYTGIGPIHLGDSTYIANDLVVEGDVDFKELDSLQTPSYANLYIASADPDTLVYNADDKEKMQWTLGNASTHYTYLAGDLTYSGNNEVTVLEYSVNVADTDVEEEFEIAVYVDGVAQDVLTDSYTFTATDTTHTFTGKAILDIDSADVIYIEGRFPTGNQTGEVIIDRASAILERKKLR